MRTIKGPGIFLAQFAGDDAPFNTLAGMAQWAAGLGFVGVQIPTWDKRLFDLKLAAESKDYCDDVLGVVGRAGLAVTELSTHLQGQLVASNPAFDGMLDGFCAAGVGGRLEGQAGVGGGGIALGGESKSETRTQCARHFFRGAGVAVFLSMAATAGGIDR